MGPVSSATGKQTLKAIAVTAKRHPQDLYEILRDAQ